MENILPWIIIIIIFIAVIALVYVVPFVLIINWYNKRVKRQFDLLCGDLGWSPESVILQMQGKFIYPAVSGRYRNMQVEIRSENSGTFSFKTSGARVSGALTRTVIVVKFAPQSPEFTVNRPVVVNRAATTFHERFDVQGETAHYLSENRMRIIEDAFADLGNACFPLYVRNGEITLAVNDLIWTASRRNKILQLIDFAVKLTG